MSKVWVAPIQSIDLANNRKVAAAETRLDIALGLDTDGFEFALCLLHLPVHKAVESTQSTLTTDPIEEVAVEDNRLAEVAEGSTAAVQGSTVVAAEQDNKAEAGVRSSMVEAGVRDSTVVVSAVAY